MVEIGGIVMIDMQHADWAKVNTVDMLEAQMAEFMQEDGYKTGLKQIKLEPKLVGQAIKEHRRLALDVGNELPGKLASGKYFEEFHFIRFIYDPKEQTFWLTNNTMFLNPRANDLEHLRDEGLKETFPDYLAEDCDQREVDIASGQSISPRPIDLASADLLNGSEITVTLPADFGIDAKTEKVGAE